jgi:hypothetical protein
LQGDTTAGGDNAKKTGINTLLHWSDNLKRSTDINRRQNFVTAKKLHLDPRRQCLSRRTVDDRPNQIEQQAKRKESGKMSCVSHSQKNGSTRGKTPPQNI